MILAFLRDLLAFADQFFPSPLSLLLPYRFSPADLGDRLDPRRLATPNDEALPTATLDVLSYNVNDVAHCNPLRTRRILRAILASRADVVLLQETNRHWEEHLAAILKGRLEHRYFHHPGRNDRPAGGIAVLSKYPLADVRVLDLTRDVDGSVFPALTCEVLVPLDRDRRPGPRIRIRVCNVHLRPPVELNGRAGLSTARTTEPIRIREARELMRRATSPFHLIAGDFNEGDDAAALRYLATLGYADALKRHVPAKKETHTWPFLRGRWTLRKRLDHVLWREGRSTTVDEGGATRAIEVRCSRCGVMTGYERDASDHQPVLARFEFGA